MTRSWESSEGVVSELAGPLQLGGFRGYLACDELILKRSTVGIVVVGTNNRDDAVLILTFNSVSEELVDSTDGGHVITTAAHALIDCTSELWSTGAKLTDNKPGHCIASHVSTKEVEADL